MGTSQPVLSFTGSTNEFANQVTFNNAGGIVLGNGADTFTFNNGVTNAGVSTVALSGTLRTDDSAIDLGDVDLSPGQQSLVSSVLDPGATATTGANITFDEVDGANSILRVDAGTGDNAVTFNGSTNLSQFLTEANNYTVAFLGNDNSIENATIFNNLGDLTFGDAASDSIEFTSGVTVSSTTTVNGTVSTTGSALDLQQLIVGEGGTARLETSGGSVSVSGLVIGEVGATDDAPENLVIAADAGSVTFDAGVNLNDVTVTGSSVALNQGATLTGALTVNSSDLSVAGQDLQILGLNTTGNVTLATNLDSQGSNVAIQGDLNIAEGTGITVSTLSPGSTTGAGGSFTVNGTIAGSGGADSESLTITAGTGDVSLQNVFGAGTSDNVAGLTDVTVTSGAFSTNQVSITGGLNVTASEGVTFADTVNLGTAQLSGTDFVINGLQSSGAVSVTASNDVTQQSGAVSVAGDASILADGDLLQQGGSIDVTGNLATRSATLDITDLSVTGQLDITVQTDSARLIHNGDLDLVADITRNLDLTNSGRVQIQGEIGRNADVVANGGGIEASGLLTVRGDSVFEAQSLTVQNGDLRGSVNFTIEDDVVINNLGGLDVQGSSTNLTLTAGADLITDSGRLQISDAASFTAANGINLDTTNNQFGSINIQSALGAVSIVEQDATNIDGVSATSFTLNSGGDVTDSLNTSIAVSGLATITSAGDITLGADATQTLNLSELNITGTQVTLDNDGTDQLTVQAINATTLSLNSDGSIVDDLGATIAVTGAAQISSLQNVQLTSGTANFGTLNLSAASASLNEASATDFAGLSIANGFVLQSQGAVNAVQGATIEVGGLFTVGAGQGVDLSGQFDALDVSATTANFNLLGTTSGSTRVDNIQAEGNVTINSTANSLVFADTEFGMQAGGDVSLQAANVILAGDEINVGSLAVTTNAGGAASVFTNVVSDNDVSIAADQIVLGNSNTVSISTLGTNGLGAITLTNSDLGATDGVLTVNGAVALETTRGLGSPGANISVLAINGELGEIGTTLDNNGAPTSLTLTAGGGDVSVGNLSDGPDLIDSFNVVSANDINLNSLFVDGNTIDVQGAGTITASGEISDTTGAVTLFTTGGDIVLEQNVTGIGGINLTADAGALTAQNLTASNGLTINTSGNVSVGPNVTVSTGDLSVASAAGTIDATDITVNSGNLNLSSQGSVTIGGSTSSSGSVQLSSTSGAVTTVGSISSGSDLNLAAGTELSVSQIDVASGDANFVAGSGDLTFNDSVNVAAGSFTGFSVEGGFVQAKDTLINAGTDIVISTQGGMKIASLSGGDNVTLSIRQTDVPTGADAPIFERVNDPITFGDESATPDVQSGTGAISFLAQVASVGTTDPEQNFVQRAGGGIFYGLVTGQFFSDDIGTSQILVNAPASATASIDALTNPDSGLGLLAGSLFTDFSTIAGDVTNALAGTDSASSNAGQTSASSSSRSTAASQQDDEDEVAEVDEAAFQNLKNYDENPQGILLPEDQQFAYDTSGNLYFMMAMRTVGGAVASVPYYKVDLSTVSSQHLVAEAFDQNFVSEDWQGSDD